MELIILASLLLAWVVDLVSVPVFLTFLVTLWYGKHYWRGQEKQYKPNYIWTGARGSWFWRVLRKWLNHHVSYPKELVPSGPVIYICRPHGVFAVSAWLTVLSGELDRDILVHDTRYLHMKRHHVLLAVHSYWFLLPGIRELALALGFIDASRESILYALEQRFSVAVLPGGVKEMGPPLLPIPDEPGILRLAQERKVPVVATYLRGEEDLFWVWHGEWRWIKAMRRVSYDWIGLFFPLIFCPRFWNWPKRLVTVMEMVPPDADKEQYKKIMLDLKVG